MPGNGATKTVIVNNVSYEDDVTKFNVDNKTTVIEGDNVTNINSSSEYNNFFDPGYATFDYSETSSSHQNIKNGENGNSHLNTSTDFQSTYEIISDNGYDYTENSLSSKINDSENHIGTITDFEAESNGQEINVKTINQSNDNVTNTVVHNTSGDTNTVTHVNTQAFNDGDLWIL